MKGYAAKLLIKITGKLTEQYRKEKMRENSKYKSLEDKHLRNARLVTERSEILKYMPKNGICAEVGVAEGGFSEQILKITEPARLHLIDCWQSNKYNDNMYKTVITKFAKEIDDGRVVIHRGMSFDVLEEFEDSYFDLVVIDTELSYKTKIREFEILNRKVKPNGIIAGHAFSRGKWTTGELYGVKEAVFTFCHEYDWEIIYLTMVRSENNSYALRRINPGT